MSSKIRSVLVVGAGWTGKQIAAQAAAFGCLTFITDSNAETLKHCLRELQSYADEQLRKQTWHQEQIDALKQNLRIIQAEESIASPIQLVIESVSEQSSTKRKVLKEYSQRYGLETIIASNSSYFVPSQLSRYVVQPQRFAHFHFHVPVAYANLVDIVPGPGCEADVTQRLQDFAVSIGQVPLIQSKENSGYVFNWMLQSLLRSSLELIDKEIATPEQIELAWKTVTKMPLGPIGIIDRIGVDVVLQVLRNARWSQDDPAIDRMIAILEPLVADGRLGWKSGKGFFEYFKDKDPSQ